MASSASRDESGLASLGHSSLAVRIKAIQDSFASNAARDGHPPSLPINILGVSRDEFSALCDSQDSCGCSIEFNNAAVLIYERSSTVHSTVAGEMSYELVAALGVQADFFRKGTDARCAFDGYSFQPDAALTPLRKPNPGAGMLFAADANGVAFPNVIVEVAFEESLPHVQAKAAAWIGLLTTVQQVIVVKVGEHALANGGRTLLAFSYVRGMVNPVQTIDFSYPAHQLSAAGAAGMQLHVPLASLYFGVPADAGAPAGLADPIALDVFWLQSQVQAIPGF